MIGSHGLPAHARGWCPISSAIRAEIRRRAQAAVKTRKRTVAGPGRPRKLARCPGCGAELSARERQSHRCSCGAF